MTGVLLLLAAASLVGARRIRRNRSLQVERDVIAFLPDAIDVLGASLRAGCSPTESLRIAARVVHPTLRVGFDAAVRELDRGARFDQAVFELRRHLPVAVEPLIDAFRNADRLGIPVAEHVDRLAFDARLARRRANDASARELPVRLTLPVVTCILPSFVIVVIVPILIGTLRQLSDNL